MKIKKDIVKYSDENYVAFDYLKSIQLFIWIWIKTWLLEMRKCECFGITEKKVIYKKMLYQEFKNVGLHIDIYTVYCMLKKARN